MQIVAKLVSEALVGLPHTVVSERPFVVRCDDIPSARDRLNATPLAQTRNHDASSGVWIARTAEELVPIFVTRAHVTHPMQINLRFGKIFSFIGPDGAGKSTLVEGVSKWLEPLAVESIYLGRGDPISESWKALARGKNKLMRRTVIENPKIEKRSIESVDRKTDPLRETLRDAANLALALKKRLRLQRMAHLRFGGRVVVTDRFPHPESYWVDGPKIGQKPSGPPLRSLFENAENRALKLYADEQPDLLFKLVIDPEVAWSRKMENRLKEIVRKVDAIEVVKFDRAVVIDLDAEQPPEVVLAAVQEAIWHAISTHPRKIEFIGLPACGKSTVSGELEKLLADSMNRSDRQAELATIHLSKTKSERALGFSQFAGRRTDALQKTLSFAFAVRPLNRDSFRRALVFIKELENTDIWSRRFSSHRQIEIHEQHLLQEIQSIAYLHDFSSDRLRDILRAVLPYAPDLVVHVALPIDVTVQRMTDRLARLGATGEIDQKHLDGKLKTEDLEQADRTFREIVVAARELGVDVVEVDGERTPREQAETVLRHIQKRRSL